MGRSVHHIPAKKKKLVKLAPLPPCWTLKKFSARFIAYARFQSLIKFAVIELESCNFQELFSLWSDTCVPIYSPVRQLGAVWRPLESWKNGKKSFFGLFWSLKVLWRPF